MGRLHPEIGGLVILRLREDALREEILPRLVERHLGVGGVDGDTGRLQNPLIHYNYDSPDQFHAKQRKYNGYDAGILKEQGVRPKFYTPYNQAVRHFWWRFVTLAGYRDGLHGLRLSAYLAYYEWLKYRRLADLWRAPEAPGS